MVGIISLIVLKSKPHPPKISPFIQAQNQMQLQMYNEMVIEIRDSTTKPINVCMHIYPKSTIHCWVGPCNDLEVAAGKASLT